MSDNIPFDIQREIIKRVPDAKSLLRFRSVSKPWKSFIDSSQFISGYRSRDTQPQSLLLSYIDNNSNEVKYVSFVDHENDILTQQQQDFAPNVPNLVKQLKAFYMIGSSCGLWCLYGIHGYNSSETQEMIVIWNPSIRRSVGIVMPRELTFNIRRKLNHFGFGVCPSTFDPTIVGIFRSLLGKYKQIGIFRLSSKTWKMIPISGMLCEYVKPKSSTQVAINRFIFWAAYDSFYCKSLILSFDLITHEFKEVDLPESIVNHNQYLEYFSLSKLRGSLVVSITEDRGRVFGVWMMGEEEDGGMTSFKKLFTINTPDSSLVKKVLGYKKSGEPIIETKKDDEGFTKIKVYDPCLEHINDDFGITGVDDSFFICPYTETLLLSDHSDGCIITNSY